MKYRHVSIIIVFAVLTVFLLSMSLSQESPQIQDGVNASFGSSTDAWAVLEVADNETERENGLMNRTELGEREGMLFIFPDEGPRAFWMKNTYIPLDMIFLDAEKEVLNIETAQPQPNISEEDLKLYRSEGPAKYVIEVNAGFADNYSVEKGDKVKWKLRSGKGRRPYRSKDWPFSLMKMSSPSV